MECSAISCNHFECGGIGHHKDCVRYPESMQSMIDDKNERIKELEQELGLTKLSLGHKTTLLSSCEAALEQEQFPSK